MDVYKKLQERLDTHPAGAPAAESFDKILRILFSPEEAEVAVNLNFTLQPVSKISQKTGIDVDTLAAMLEGMADRGVIFAKKKPGSENRYCLLPTIPGLFEFPFMRPEHTPHIKELGELWEEYHREGLGNSFAGSPTPMMRVVPVEETITMTSEVVPYEIVSDMISRAEYISLTNCACRVSRGACDKPLEVCFSFDDMARFLVERDRARFIDKEEALKILRYAAEEGLVHTINNSSDKLTVICNCCGCCCTLLRGITELNNPNSISTSGYVISYTPDECIGCHLCVERCPMAALEENEDKVQLYEERCIGCGLCAFTCPTESLILERRADIPEVVATGRELFNRVLKEKGKLEAFIRLNQE
ncbi:MAG: 4Fe-4S binding protein [Syntrophomonadaceae bacterium]|nr:4Fe-4S binding protein [Syntrophomonadaceae bacterium]